MSRIIVKGLPDKISESQLKEKFNEKGTITECSLKYGKDGVFRKFAFIGYKEASMAEEAVKYFNQSFINTSKIHVTIATDMSEKNLNEKKKEPWSKVNKKLKESKTEVIESNKKATNHNNTATEHALKVTGLPPKIKKEEIEKFFHPIKCHIQAAGKLKGKTVVCFNSEKDKDESMKRNKNYIGVKKIFLHKFNAPTANNNNKKNNKSDDDDDEEDSDEGDDIGEEKNESQKEDKNKERELISETGRLFVKNLPYCATTDELEEHFNKYGELEVQLQIDKYNENKSKGFCLVSYVLPENALKAYNELDGTIFQGRMLHILGGKARREENHEDLDSLPFNNKKKQILKKLSASNVKSWNSLFVGGDAVADVVAKKNDVSKHDLLMHDSDVSVAAHLALEQTRIVNETRKFLLNNGVSLDSFSQPSALRSQTVLLAKHLPAYTKVEELETVFQKFSQAIKRIILPPNGLTAIVEFSNPIDAATAFKTLAYTRFKHLPLYLEKAPMDIFKKDKKSKKDSKTDNLEFSTEDAKKKEKDDDKEETSEEEDENEDDESDDEEEEEEEEVNLSEPRRSVFFRNMPANVTEEDIKKEFKEYGSIVSVTLIKARGTSGNEASSGFIEWGTTDQAENFVRARQKSSFKDNVIELKVSDRLVKDASLAAKKIENKLKKNRKKKNTDKGISNKIIMRNVPFEASEKDLKQLLSVFTGVKAIRLPKKTSDDNTGSNTHRGFAFVEFVNKTCAKRTFNQLCHNTALYGRRLNLQYCKSSSANEDVQKIRKRTAEKYNPDQPKKSKKSDLVENLNKLKH